MLDRPDWKSLTRDQKIEIVRPLVDEGLSASQIAERFSDVTRNTIIGLCSRLKWKLKGSVGRSANAIENAKIKAKPRGYKGQPKVNAIINAVASRARIEQPVFAAEPFDAESEVGNDVTKMVGLLDLTNHHCRWPVGPETGARQMFCGAHASLNEGRPYCTAHSHRAEGRR